MSWYYKKAGHSKKMAEVVKDQIIAVGGCPKGSAEEAAKNALGEIAETLCKSLIGNKVVLIEASGSAHNDTTGAHSQSVSFKLETVYEFVE